MVALCVVTLALFLSLTAAYALGRVKFRGRGTVLMMVLGVSMFPQVAVLSGLFEVIRALGLYNTSWALILSYTIFTLPFTVWVLTTFMGELPHELEEAAIMDGASPWVTLTRVLLPLLGPPWSPLAYWPLSQRERVPVRPDLHPHRHATHGTGRHCLDFRRSPHELPWGLLMAASVLVTVPLVILVLIFQRRIVSGLTAGASKG